MEFKKPPSSYVHPRKKSKLSVETLKPELSANDVGKKSTAIPKSTKSIKQRSSMSREQDFIMLRLLAPIPKMGECNTFDKLIDSGLSSKDAALGLLKKGFDDFEQKISSGTYMISPNVFTISKDIVETNRRSPLAFYNSAIEFFDPYELLTKRALGLKIGTAILNLQLSKDI